jgi:heat shock protein HslJ
MRGVGKTLVYAGTLAVALLAATACGARSGDEPGTDPGSESGAGAPAVAADEPWGKEYVLTKATVDGKPHTLIAGTTVTLRFEEDRRLRASAGCNSIVGRVSLDEGRIVGEGFAMTQIACPGDQQEQDEWLAGFLDSEPTWQLSEDSELNLRAGKTELLLTDKLVAEPARPLIGTLWTLDTLVDGETASSTTAGVPPATVRFTEQEVEVFTGCNGGSSGYRFGKGQVTFEPLVLTRKACAPEVMRQEQTVVAVLSGTAKMKVESDLLTIDHPSGKGLRLRAE